MVDTSSIDLVALIERYAAIRFGKPVGRNEKRTQKGGPCPFCGLGDDRFAVFINEVPQRYYCGIHGNGCDARGDAITFVREYLHMDSHHEACEFLDVDPGSEYTGPRHRNVHTDEEPPCKQWMERAELFCMECKARLWSEIGKRALDWLYQRGFTDSIIQRAGLGLNLAEGYQSAKEWGVDEDLWISRGIVIPWSVGGAIWKVNVRRSDKDIAAENARLRAKGKKENAAKYRMISGGTNCLYGVDLIQPGKTLVMVEGEFDALALLQATERRVAVVATGSTANGRGDTWVEAIKQANPVLLAFDDDANKAGDSAASIWNGWIPQSIRWLPWSHDINDMLRERMNIEKWVELGVEVAKEVTTPKPVEASVSECEMEGMMPDEPLLCGLCLDAGMETVATCEDAEGNMYCAEHDPVRQPVVKPVLSKEEIAQRFADVLPGRWTVHFDPPGYTIQDRARELVAEREERIQVERKRLFARLNGRRA